jgi:hypothetical protein
VPWHQNHDNSSKNTENLIKPWERRRSRELHLTVDCPRIYNRFERLVCNQEVEGSIPFVSTRIPSLSSRRFPCRSYHLRRGLFPRPRRWASCPLDQRCTRSVEACRRSQQRGVQRTIDRKSRSRRLGLALVWHPVHSRGECSARRREPRKRPRAAGRCRRSRSGSGRNAALRLEPSATAPRPCSSACRTSSARHGCRGCGPGRRA